MFFKRWIDAGLIYLSSFRFRNGTLDEEFVYEKVKQKQNIFCEILCVKETLKPYEQTIREISVNTTAVNTPTLTKNSLNRGCNRTSTSRFQYKQTWKRVFDEYDINFEKVFLRKIKFVRDNVNSILRYCN